MVEHQEKRGLEEILEKGERVFWRTSPDREALAKPNWVLKAMGWVTLLLSIGFLLAGIAGILKGRPFEAIIFFFMFIPWVIAAFYLGFGRDYIFSRIAKNSQYILTDRRLIIRTGIFRIKDIIAQLSDIKAVEANRVESQEGDTVGEVIIRVGSPGLRISRLGSASASQPRGRSDDLILFGVRNPQEIASLLKAASNAARLSASRQEE